MKSNLQFPMFFPVSIIDSWTRDMTKTLHTNVNYKLISNLIEIDWA